MFSFHVRHETTLMWSWIITLITGVLDTFILVGLFMQNCDWLRMSGKVWGGHAHYKDSQLCLDWIWDAKLICLFMRRLWLRMSGQVWGGRAHDRTHHFARKLLGLNMSWKMFFVITSILNNLMLKTRTRNVKFEASLFVQGDSQTFSSSALFILVIDQLENSIKYKSKKYKV